MEVSLNTCPVLQHSIYLGNLQIVMFAYKLLDRTLVGVFADQAILEGDGAERCLQKQISKCHDHAFPNHHETQPTLLRSSDAASVSLAVGTFKPKRLRKDMVKT